MILTIGTGLTAQGFNPSELEWSLQDVSSPDSGRDLDAKMWKERLPLPNGQKIKLVCKFNNVTWREASRILNAIQPEYITVTYPDILALEMKTKEFYVGDRSCPVYMWTGDASTADPNKLLSSVSFDLIER